MVDKEFFDEMEKELREAGALLPAKQWNANKQAWDDWSLANDPEYLDIIGFDEEG